MLPNQVTEPVDNGCREIASHVVVELRGVGQVRLEDQISHAALRIRHEHRKLRARHALAEPRPFRHVLGRWQVFDLPVEDAVGLEIRHELLVRLEPPGRCIDLLREDLGLEEVVEQDPGYDVVDDGGHQFVAVVAAELAPLLGEAEEDLQVHLTVGAVHTAGVVDEIGVDSAPASGVFDTAFLSEAKIAALTDDSAPHLASIDAQRVVGAVADLAMRLMRCLDESADASVPEQIDRSQQNGPDQGVRRERLVPLDPECGTCLG